METSYFVAGFTDWILEAAINDVCGTSQPSAPAEAPGEFEFLARGMVVTSLRQGLQTSAAERRSLSVSYSPALLEQAAKTVTATIFGDVEGSLRAELSTQDNLIATQAKESDDDTEVVCAHHTAPRPAETSKSTEPFKSPRDSLLATGSSATTVIISASAPPTPAQNDSVDIGGTAGSSTPAPHESANKSKSVALRRMHVRKKTNQADRTRFGFDAAL
jgi:hypothetical protein